MLKRTITAVCAIALFIPVCIFSNTLIFPVAMAILSTVGVYEMLGCVGAKKHGIISVVSLIFGFVLPILPYFINGNAETKVTLEAGICILYLIFVYACDVFSKGKLEYTTSSAAFMGVFYISVSFASIVLLREKGSYLYLLTFIGPWVSDTFAYLIGKGFGKHKLIPEVSPKKTVEGSIGGIVFASVAFVLYGFIISRISGGAGANYVVLAISGALVSVVSQIGDLSASVVKRKFGVKDYGFIFPGHGGVMDRFDSVIMTAPILYMISQLPIGTSMLPM